MTEKKESLWDTYKWPLTWALCVIVMLTVFNIFETWQSAIDKDYLSRLTPEERQEILAEKEAVKQESIERQKEFFKGWIDFFNFQVPLWLFAPILFVAWVYRGRLRW